VYTVEVLRNITLSAEETLIERARRRASQRKTSLNVAFRQWLERYAGSDSPDKDYLDLMKQLRDVDAGRKFTRAEMNSR
jgi:hypothetical protein